MIQDNANNDNGDNPNGINWFSGDLDSIKAELDTILNGVANADATAISNEDDFVTLLSQLQLMAEVGDPANKDQVSKEEFKQIDFDSVIAPGTTGETMDGQQILDNLTTQILQATGDTEIDPTFLATLTDSTGKTANQACFQIDAFNTIISLA